MPKLLYVDMDNVLVDFTSACARVQPELLREYDGRLDEIPGIFSLMDPVPHANASFYELATKFDTYVLSTSPWENPSAWSDKLLWVKRHLDQAAYKRLILTHHKNLNHGHFLVDDRTKNGADRFQGEHLHFGSARFPNWPAVVIYLKKQINPTFSRTPIARHGVPRMLIFGIGATGHPQHRRTRFFWPTLCWMGREINLSGFLQSRSGAGMKMDARLHLSGMTVEQMDFPMTEVGKA